MSDDLMPCPFCGVHMAQNKTYFSHPEGRVPCPLTSHGFGNEHRERWNTRSSSSSELVEAAGALVAKLDECAPHMANQAVYMHARGFRYSGPQYGEALETLRSALTSPFSAGGRD